MFCTRCGSEVQDGSAFCHACGASLKANDQTQMNETEDALQEVIAKINAHPYSQPVQLTQRQEVPQDNYQEQEPYQDNYTYQQNSDQQTSDMAYSFSAMQREEKRKTVINIVILLVVLTLLFSLGILIISALSKITITINSEDATVLNEQLKLPATIIMAYTAVFYGFIVYGFRAIGRGYWKKVCDMWDSIVNSCLGTILAWIFLSIIFWTFSAVIFLTAAGFVGICKGFYMLLNDIATLFERKPISEDDVYILQKKRQRRKKFFVFVQVLFAVVVLGGVIAAAVIFGPSMPQ